MKTVPGLKILAFLLIPLLFGACATDRPPTGGPPDRSPLSVTASMPEPGAVNVSPKEIRIVFSHYVGKEALAQALFFSPVIRDYEIDMHGKEAVIRLYSPLKQNRTYTLTIRKSLKSLFGNHLFDRSWSLAFSTGALIDKGSIDGRIWTNRMAPAPGITVMAFIPDIASELLSSASARRPDYLVQTGALGEFRFDNLATGKYRVVALIDNNGNGQFDPGKESFGVTSSPSVETGTTGLALRLAPDNIAATSLRSCRTINDREIEITLSTPFPARAFDLSTIEIEDTGTRSLLPVLARFSPSRSGTSTTRRLVTAPMSGTAWYRLRFSPAGAGSASSELTFSGNPHVEQYPQLSVSIIPSDGSDNVMPETIRPESGSSIELRFNLPVDESSLGGAVSLSSTGKEGRTNIPFTIAKIDDRTFCVLPSEGFRHGIDYRISVHTDRIRGVVGSRAAASSMTVSKFTTAGPEAYGEITGNGKATGSIVVIEARQAGREPLKRLVVKPSTTGTFTFSLRDLPPGEYTVTGFAPATADTLWNSGTVEPFRPSDPFTAATVSVRAGWTSENVSIDIPPTRQGSGKPQERSVAP